MIQGGRERHERNREPFAFDARSLTHVVLSHAHIDHSGRLALLRKAGYHGPIVTTEPTARLLEILLSDSGRIQEEDARWKIKRLTKQGKDASWVTPLYTEDEALQVLEQVETVGFDTPYRLGEHASVTFVEAGHILGAAIVDLRCGTGDAARRLVFSGDLGVPDARLLGPPHAVPCPDYLIIESTYGDRERREGGDRTEQLFEIVSRTIDRGGKVVIPSFAVGRTQEVLTRLNDLVEGGTSARVGRLRRQPDGRRGDEGLRAPPGGLFISCASPAREGGTSRCTSRGFVWSRRSTSRLRSTSRRPPP